MYVADPLAVLQTRNKVAIESELISGRCLWLTIDMPPKIIFNLMAAAFNSAFDQQTIFVDLSPPAQREDAPQLATLFPHQNRTKLLDLGKLG
jgi:hypothetical protein